MTIDAWFSELTRRERKELLSSLHEKRIALDQDGLFQRLRLIEALIRRLDSLHHGVSL